MIHDDSQVIIPFHGQLQWDTIFFMDNNGIIMKITGISHGSNSAYLDSSQLFVA